MTEKGIYTAASGNPRFVIANDEEFNKKIEILYYMMKAISITYDDEKDNNKK